VCSVVTEGAEPPLVWVTTGAAEEPEVGTELVALEPLEEVATGADEEPE
jgi:hypothetical protein